MCHWLSDEHTVDVLVPSISGVVPVVETKCHQILLGGDQLTVARARGSQLAMADGCSVSKRMEGLVPVVEDWHTRVVLAEVRLYYDCMGVSCKFTGYLEVLL